MSGEVGREKAVALKKVKVFGDGGRDLEGWPGPATLNWLPSASRMEQVHSHVTR